MVRAEKAVNNGVPLKSVAERIDLPKGFESWRLAEIRLRAGREAAAVRLDGATGICSKALLSEDIEECFREICGNSVHSYRREISEGYITIAGGHRVGFCGTYTAGSGGEFTLKNISSINIRFAREVIGSAEEIYNQIFSKGLSSMLLIGKPLSGKTTILRDLSRILGSRHRVALIDTRGELAGCVEGVPQLNVGVNTDVLTGYPKSTGIMCAIRSLSPEVVICDEIGDDAEALEQCMYSGVKIIASIHASGIEEIKARADIGRLVSRFETMAVIGSKGKLIETREVSV